jgi:tRNA1(Val) A37 N6-methylase TrmN6
MNALTTIDGLLNNRIKIEQPENGYRVAVDTLLLAAAVPAQAREEVLELGCGVGGAMLALACRVPGAKITGIEIQGALARLCLTNIERNARHNALKVMTCDATRLPLPMENAFDHVMMNPPYHEGTRHNVSADEGKRIANTESEGNLPLWIASAAKALKDGGMLTLIHRADRREEIAGLLKSDFGALLIKPVVSKPDGPPKRILLRAVKGAPFAQTILEPLIMHNHDGSFTPEADGILRDAGAMEFT